MAAPVINQYIEAVALTLGAPYSHRYFAPGATGWVATGLPVGLSIDSTGTISGVPTEVGETLAIITPSNGDGDGESLQVSYGVSATIPEADSLAVPLDFDLETGELRWPGKKSESDELFLGTVGDLLPIDLGLMRSSRRCTIDLSALEIGLKEYVDETLFSLSPDPADILAIGLGQTRRYRSMVSLASDELRGIVSDYTSQDGKRAYFAAVAEIQIEALQLPPPAENPASTTVDFEITQAGLGGRDQKTASLPIASPGAYTLLVSVAESGFTTMSFTVNVVIGQSGPSLVVASATGEVGVSNISAGHAPDGGGRNLACVLDGGFGAVSCVGNTIEVKLYAYYNPGSGTLTPSATLTLTPLAGDGGSEGSAIFRRTTRPFNIRVELDRVIN